MSAKSVQWKGDNIIDVYALMTPIVPVYMGKQFSNADEIVGVPTPQGLRVAFLGDWITKCSDGTLAVNETLQEDN